MLERNPESLKVLAIRSLENAYFERLQAAVLVDEPDYAAIEVLMRPPVMVNDDLQPLISSLFARAWRYKFWPMMIEMFKGQSKIILEELLKLRQVKYLEQADRLIKVQEILFQYLGHQFSSHSCVFFNFLFNQRCHSIEVLTKSAANCDFGFTKENIENDFNSVIYTIPEYVEKYCLPFLATLREAKLEFVAAEAAGEDPCKAHMNKLIKLFEFSFIYGSANLLNGVLELLNNDDCLWLIRSEQNSDNNFLQTALSRKHPEVLCIFIKKWHDLLLEFPAERTLFLISLKTTLCSIRFADLQSLHSLFKICVDLSVPIEGAAHPELLTQRLFPIDVTSVISREGQHIPFLDMMAHFYIYEGGFNPRNKMASLFLIEFLKHHLRSLDEVIVCEEIFRARLSIEGSYYSTNEFVIQSITDVFSVLSDHFSALLRINKTIMD